MGFSVGVSETERVKKNLLPTTNQDERGDIYTELWRACAGPRAYVPRVGEKVFYFPQGHLEQVEAYTKQEANMEMPTYELPSKVLCKVVHVLLKSELETDEVFAQVTLLPETMLDEPSGDVRAFRSPQQTRLCSFCKTLTPSDTSSHGGFSIPKQYAKECLPPLDLSQEPPTQELVAKDLHGVEWHFRHIFRGQPKRHLLTSGWSSFVSSKKLIAGDAIIFIRGDNGDLHVGVRRALEPQKNATSSMISGHSMQMGVLATASHAIATGTMFSIYYWPRTNSQNFLVPYKTYMESMKDNYSVGLGIRMKFEGECVADQRSAGTLVGVEAADSARWPDSKWRCLKVRWDEASPHVHLERVSPWMVELFDTTKNMGPSLPPEPKRGRTCFSSSPESSVSYNDGLPKSVSELPLLSERQSGVLQGQEIAVSANEVGIGHEPAWARKLSPLGLDISQQQTGFEAQLYFPIHDQFSLNLSTAPQFHSGLCKYGTTGNVWLGDAPNPPINSTDKIRVFGVDVVVPREEPSSPKFQIPSEMQRYVPDPQSLSEFSVLESDQHPVALRNPDPFDGNGNSLTIRSCIKVHKFGLVLGRSIDLKRLSGYNELVRELDQMFDFEGGLIKGNTEWNVIYTDDEGDIMLLGDYPWQDFRSMVRKLFIFPKEEIDKLDPSSPNLLNTL